MVAASVVGRSGKCRGCGERFYVYDLDAPPIKPVPLLANREYAGVGCQVCGTRMYGRLTDVGRRLKCPDCGNCTVLPPIKAKRPPKPIQSVDAYDLESDGYSTTSGAKFVADGFTFHCALCGSLLAGSLASVGSEVECHDCGKKNRVPPPSDRPLVRLVSDGDEYELEAVSTETSSLQSSLYADYQTIDEAEKARRIARVATDRRSRPTPPPWPTAQGVFKIVRSTGFWSRVWAISAFLVVAWVVGVWSIGAMMQATIGFGAMSAIAGMCFLALAGMVAFGACMYLAAMGIAIVTESSEGNDTVDEWPVSNPMEWFGESLYLLVAVSVSGLPGWIIAQGVDPMLRLPIIAASTWLLTPLVLLSQLEASMPFALFIPTVYARAAATLPHWLVFYVCAGGCYAIAIAAGIGLGILHPMAATLVTPALVVAALVYFRGIGRLAWVMRHEAD